MACEKGASSWLTVLPLIDHGFALLKGAFRDALCLRYGWLVPELPTTCVSGLPLEIEHALSCHFGGLPIQRHNEVRNLLASCIRKAGCETAIKPPLQRLSGEQFTRPSTTTDDEARLDITTASFWGGGGGGMGARKHFSTSGCSIRSLPRTVPSQCQRCIGVTSVKSGLAMKSGCVKSRELHSLRLCSRRQEEPASSRPP